MIGQTVLLQEMLDCRERRNWHQQQLISKYHQPVVSFTMNIPGPIKTNPDIQRAFQVGKQNICNLLTRLQVSVLEAVEFHENTGDELLLCLEIDASALKEQATIIEEQHPLGRLFDIDIIDVDGEKLSRSAYRKCFICDAQAQQCARNRTHSVDEMQIAVEQLLKNYDWGYKIGAVVLEAILLEVSASPKPGLVDRNNCGAHRDMTFSTFMSSAAALSKSFAELVQLGIDSQALSIRELLPAVRRTGIQAEKRMYEMTGGINTHKGMIFTLGILAACAGWAVGRMVLTKDTLCNLAAQMCAGICAAEYQGLDEKSSLTKGEKIYLLHGLTGVRGEVESGYKTVREISLPVYTALRDAQVDINDALVQTLLYLIAATDDTNIISRHDMAMAQYAKQAARRLLDEGGIFASQGHRVIRELDQDFIERYISPGGCADLLAVTHFLYTLERSLL